MAAEALLSSLLGLLLLGLLLPASLTGGVGSLNLEELSEMRYGIEILPLPVMGGQSQASDVVIVSSKYKQRYECRLPAGAIHFQREREEEAPAYRGPGIPELLNPMKDAPCLLKTKDWWTYEFCYGRHIQQYHIEDSEIKGEFLCDEGAGVSGDYIDRVDEPLSCSYVLTIRTPRLCPHPLLRPPPSAAPQAILCHPALQPEEYMAYVQRQADSKQYGDRVLEELQGPEPHMWSEAQQGAVPSERAGARPAEDDGKESNFWKMLHEPEEQTHGAEEAQAEEQEPNPEVADPAPGPPHDFQNNVQVKVIRSPADLIRLIEELKGGSKKGRPDGGQEQPADDAAEVPHREAEVKGKSDADHQNEVEEEEEEEEEDEDEEEQQLLGEFEKELEGILLPSDRDRLRSEVKAGMERELENIIQETEKELGPDGLQKESERDRAMLALTSTLNKLIKRLEEKQSPELVKKHRKRRVVPKKPPPSPQTAGKIEIKIVRPGAEGTEEDARWLTDEDTRNLKEIFFNILVQGAEEAQKERQRQKELESNYRRVWGSRGGEGTGDLEEFDF
ncbi:PREDICTED: protein OS-9 isoform X8 [Odobenus rosmarus divergens]|uniref:Endoplasmic reticulum lectin n=1 Tax=Odobenus rosmarus divergens TaxID=9708 RepID=A0A2U3W1D9_ODORO|nr:PREDICTED: protein OS-9 isoform X8 [Odobenus rosmarus divergens]